MRLCGLVTFAQFNGDLFEVVGPRTSEERMAVSVFGGDKQVSIKKENMTVIIPGEERLDSTRYHTSDCPFKMSPILTPPPPPPPRKVAVEFCG